MKKIWSLVLILIILFMPTSCMYDLNNNSNNGSISGNNNIDNVVSVPRDPNLKSFKGAIQSMGTIIELTLFTENKLQADKAYNDVKKIFDTYDKVADAQNELFINFNGKEFDETTIKKNINKAETNGTISELAKLNYYRTLNNASQELVDLLKFSIQMYEDTNGYFNPFLGYLNERWKAVINGLRKPELNNQGENIYYSKPALEAKVIIEGRNITLSSKVTNNSQSFYKNGYLVDLGGIAKGYATKVAREYLDENYDYYLLNAGSSNISVGEFNDKNQDFWNISVGYPLGYPSTPNIKNIDGYWYVDNFKTNLEARDNAKVFIGEGILKNDYYLKNNMKPGDVFFSTTYSTLYLVNKVVGSDVNKMKIDTLSSSIPAQMVQIKNEDIVTSSPESQHVYIDGKLYHHLLDPFTGAPTDINTKGKSSVTLIGLDSAMLDAYTTALFAMDLESAKKFVEARNLKAIFITLDGVIKVGF